MNECWSAFALALISHVYLTPERAFEQLNVGEKPRKKAGQRKEITAGDVIDMVEMKETMTYKEIGKIYGLKADAVYGRIRRYRGKK